MVRCLFAAFPSVEEALLSPAAVSQDGYAVDDWGLHHRVLNAVVETEPGTNCYGIIDVYSDRLELRGTGNMVSAAMLARHSGSNDCIR